MLEPPPGGYRSDKYCDETGVFWMPGLKEPGTGDPNYRYNMAEDDPLIRWTPAPVDIGVQKLEAQIAEAKM